MRPLVTAEVVHALSRAGRSSGPAAQRGIAWLRSREFAAIDYRARALRALAAAGVNVEVAASELLEAGDDATGWGTVEGSPPGSLETALALGALKAANPQSPSPAGQVSNVLARRRADNGWSGDFVPVDAPQLRPLRPQKWTYSYFPDVECGLVLPTRRASACVSSADSERQAKR